MKYALETLKKTVEIESPTGDKRGIDSLAAFVADRFRETGAAVEILSQGAGGDALRAVWRAGHGGAPVLVLGHLDTVWPVGTVLERPFEVRDGKAFGPGVFDMKAGILLSVLVCRAFQRELYDPGKDVVFLFTPDEEGSGEAASSLLRRLAPGCRAVLCLEPPLPGGLAKTSRKGVGEVRLQVKGISAHAGLDHEKGASAVLELCRLVNLLEGMTDYPNGVTVNVGLIRGGSALNVVPGTAEAVVDFRFPTMVRGEKLERAIGSLTPSDPRCRLQIVGGIQRMPLERTDAVVGLFRKAREAALRVGMELGEGAAGGASDGSFTAAMGLPTLDGLGVPGDGAHADHEHIVVADIPQRAAFLCELLRAL
ncbi:MAG: M20 family metallopeptidase [Acidobacteria bacterium]|nr:M20 family metallopeptidase [Acidobacteriota bacterium]